ncbi:MAG: DUF362 domain-containing protein [Bacillota bacterium]|jgi:uncharacterized protein (DUF362 family)/Pyruvate/2-oxoacid:ferredoxin oxidoreductase delta subunit
MSTVVIKSCRDYQLDRLQQVLDAGMEQLGGWRRFIQPGQKVLLKVNLIGPVSPEKAATTHPEFVRAVVRAVKACGAEVWVGDSAGGAIAGLAPTARALEVCGFASICREEGARLVNFDSEPAVAVPSRTKRVFKEFYVAKAITEADVIINLPKFKCHSAQIYTGAVKNLFGALPGLSKAEYHKAAPDNEAFGELVADLHQACGVDLNIMDAVIGHEGNGPTAGSPKEVGYLLLSADPVALDTVACEMMGVDAEQVSIVRHAARLGLGSMNWENIELRGDETKPPRIPEWRLPTGGHMRGPRWLLPKLINFMRTQPMVDTRLCRHCNMCVDSCPVEAIDPKSKRIDYELCIGCLCCHELCPQQAVMLRRMNPLARVMLRRLDQAH